MSGIKLEDILQIEKAMDTARDDNTPYAVYGKHDNGTFEVVGDANKTQQKYSDYVIRFRYRIEELPAIPEGSEVIANHFVIFSHTFKDITITPRSDITIVNSMMDILPFFAEMGSIREEREDLIEGLEKQYNARIKIEDETPSIIIGDESKRQELTKKVADVFETFGRKCLTLYINAGDQLQLALYNFVATLLQIDDELGAHMLPASVIKATVKIIETYPELYNEAETLFGLS